MVRTWTAAIHNKLTSVYGSKLDVRDKLMSKFEALDVQINGTVNTSTFDLTFYHKYIYPSSYSSIHLCTFLLNLICKIIYTETISNLQGTLTGYVEKEDFAEVLKDLRVTGKLGDSELHLLFFNYCNTGEVIACNNNNKYVITYELLQYGRGDCM